MTLSRRHVLATDPAIIVQQLESIAARLSELPAVHAALEHFWKSVDQSCRIPPDNTWKLMFSTALVEVMTNVVHHGHPDPDTETTVQLELIAYNDRVEARITDQGAAFQETPDTVEPDVFAESGRGLLIARAALDTLEYRQTPSATNQWLLLKRFTD